MDSKNHSLPLSGSEEQAQPKVTTLLVDNSRNEREKQDISSL